VRPVLSGAAGVAPAPGSAALLAFEPPDDALPTGADTSMGPMVVIPSPSPVAVGAAGVGIMTDTI
jgi:hypothetical protein